MTKPKGKNKKKVAMKQVTVMVEVALTMEVPVDMDCDQVSEFVKNNTRWDVTTTKPNIEMVELSDILDVSDFLGDGSGIKVGEIVEAPID
jgi:hypothetical protein